ncbi:MAG TPA: tetraacyldisaccharide 4'-kinase [Cyclobacteriaceae bacterium]
MSVLRFLLLPFALIYDWITRLRNHLYDIDYKHAIEFDRVVISVGNLNVGGSGKTPMIEYLIRLLTPQFNVATLSRGYGRKTRGFRMASNEDSAKTVGDEPFQFYLKFKDQISVTVGEDRALAIPEMLMQKPEIDIVLLDDAFQHRPVKPDYSILLTEYANPFYSDFILPMGTLREARAGVKRADVIVVTKCPTDISSKVKAEMKSIIQRYAVNKPIYFSAIKYGNPVPINGYDNNSINKIVAVSGIAHSSTFKNHLESAFLVTHHFDFADHHGYSTEDIVQIEQKAKSIGQDLSIMTTEKDMVKLLPFKEQLSLPWFYVPIETIFMENGAEFDGSILQTMKS